MTSYDSGWRNTLFLAVYDRGVSMCGDGWVQERIKKKEQKDREWLELMRDQARERARLNQEQAEHLYGGTPAAA